MPADYVAVRDSCIKNKEKSNNGPASKQQVQDCKRMAAIWWVKKHGKPFPKKETDESKAQLFDITDIHIEHNKSISDIVSDGVAKLNISYGDGNQETIFMTIPDKVLPNDGFYFTQPFSKEESGYAESSMDQDGSSEKCCGFCIHKISSSPNLTNWDVGFCHLVQGLIDNNFVCDYFADTLIQSDSD
jgi:hypothetical protein